MNETEQYKTVCKGAFAEINEKLDRMFIDNGRESFQSKLNRHDLFIKKSTKIIYIVAIAVGGLSLDAIRDIIVSILSHVK